MKVLLAVDNVNYKKQSNEKWFSNFSKNHGINLSFLFPFLGVLLLLMPYSKVNAQVSALAFTETAGTYTAITGTQVHAAGTNDAVANVTLPFNFVYNGTSYATVNVSTNGFIVFGSGNTASNYTPISGSLGAGVISAFGRDLVTGVVTTTTGAAPNRVFTIQWTGYRNGFSGMDDLNFQLKLSETSGAINIVYGNFTTTFGSSDNTPQIGLRGTTNADFNNLSLTNSANWNTVIEGTANNAAVRFRNSAAPTAGLTWTWTPPCPSAITVSPATASLCPTSSAVQLTAGTTSYSVFAEDFNGGLLNWTKTNTSVGGTVANADWTARANGYSYNTTTFNSNDASQFYMTNSNSQAGTTTVTTFTSPAFSTVDATAGSLTFYHFFRNSDAGRVQYSTDGTNFTNITTYSSTTGSSTSFSLATLTLPAGALNQATVYIRFRYEATNDYYWLIDNMNVSITKGVYNWAQTNGLFTDAAATAAYTGTLISSVYAKPTATSSYTASASTFMGCTTTSSAATITVNPTHTATLSSAAGTNLQTVCANSAVTNITYALGSGATSATVTGLPSGVTASVSGGVVTISGTPTVAGSYNYTLTTSGTTTCTTTASGNITVNGLATLALTSSAGTNLQTVCQANAITAITYAVGGTATGASVSGLPTGITGTYSGGLTISGSSTVAGVYPYTVLVTSSNGCTLPTATGTITITAQAPATVPGTYTSSSINQTDGTTKIYNYNNCISIGQIKDAASGNVLGNTTMSTTLLATAPSPNSEGYVLGRRSYRATAASTGAATMKMYFTQADFDNYNANNTGFLDLPTSGNNLDVNKQYFRIAKMVGTVTTITGPMGDSLTWNGTYWVANIPVTDVNTNYYFVTMASCEGITVNNLQATNVQGTSVTATWDNLTTTPAWGWFSFQYRQVGSSTWIGGLTSNNGVTSRFIPNLMPGITYELQIRRHCSSQTTGPWSPSVVFTTPSAPCAYPPVLANNSVTSNSGIVQWVAVSGAAYYEIQYKLSSGSTWINAGTYAPSSNSGVLTRTITGLVPSTAYTVQVKSYCPNGVGSSWSTAVNFTTSAAVGCFVAPTMTTSNITPNSAVLSWGTYSNAGWFEFRYKASSSSTWISAGTLIGTSTTKTLTGLAATTQYDVQARSFCSTSGGSAWSSTVQFTTTGAAGCYLPPVMTTSNVNSTSISVSWPVISGAAYYEFRYQAFGATTWTSGGTLIGTNTSKTFTGLTPGVDYLIQARTFCSSTAGSAWSTSLMETTEDPALCNNAPILTLSNLTMTTAKFTWPAGQGSAWYEFRYRVVGATIWTSAGTITGAVTTKTLTGLTAGTTYEFQAKSYCSSTSFSGWGASSVFTTPSATRLQSENGVSETTNNETTVRESFTVQVVPNPFHDNIQLSIETEMQLETIDVLIVDLSGKIVQTIPNVAIQNNQTERMDIDAIEPGLYHLYVTQAGKLLQIEKIVKM